MDGRKKIAEILLQNKANPNSLNGNKDTPLISAADDGYSKLVEVLLKHGADKNILSGTFFTTPLERAKYRRKRNYKEVIALLEEQN